MQRNEIGSTVASTPSRHVETDQRHSTGAGLYEHAVAIDHQTVNSSIDSSLSLTDRSIVCRISGKKSNHYEQMKRQIEEEIEDEIALEEEKYKKVMAEYKAIEKRRKLQGLRKVSDPL